MVMVTAFSQADYIEQASSRRRHGLHRQAVHAHRHRPGDADRGLALRRGRALEAEVADLTTDWRRARLVDKAKGVLMARGMSEPEAFRRLQKLAMDRRKTLREVAEAVVLASDVTGT